MRFPARYAVIVAAIFVVALLAAFRGAVLRAAIATIVPLATGYTVGYDDLRAGRGGIVVTGLHVTRRGEPVLDARQIDIAYDLREFLRGGAHRLGLLGVTVDAPHVTVIRHKDLSLNIALPQGGGGGPEPGPPWSFTARVRDGSIEIRDPFNPSPSAHVLHVDGIDADAGVQSDHRTHYRVTVGTPKITIAGTIDRDRAYAIHRVRAAAIPVAGFVDYFIDSTAARFLSGEARDLDVHLYSLGSAPYGVSGSVRVDGISARVVGIEGTVQHLRGTLQLTNSGIVAQRLDADLNGTPIVTGGGFFDFVHPQFRIGVRGAADLQRLRGFFTFLRGQPLAGPVRFSTLIEGGVGNPLIFARVAFPHATWSQYRFERGSGLVAYYDNTVTMLPLQASFGPIAAVVRGGMAIAKGIDSEFAVAMHGAGREVPYLDRVAPDLPLQGVAIAAGHDLALHARGLLYGRGPQTSLSGFLAMDERGRGEFGPLTFDRADHSEFSGSFFLDRPTSNSGFWAWSQGYRFADPPHPATLPGVTLPVFPPFGGVLDGAFAGAGAPSNFTIAGWVNGHDMEFVGIPVARGAVTFGGTFHELRLSSIDAQGTWGHITGAGAVAIPGAFLMRGNFDGTLAGLRRFTGDIGARGDASGPFAIAVDGNRVVVQTTNVSLRDASIHGIPLSGFGGTLLVDPRGPIDVYGVDAQVAGGNVVAARTRGGGIAVTGAGIPARSLGGAGLPLEQGSLAFVGTAGITAGSPTFDGGFALSDGALAGHRIAITSGLAFSGASLQVDDATGMLDGAIAMLDGRVAGFGGTPSYALHARVPAADLGVLAPAFGVRLPYLTGSLEADLQVAGVGTRPSVAGTIAVPEGSINGLHFGDVQAEVSGTPAALAISQATARVGSTTATLQGKYAHGAVALAVRSDAADLADFNGFFDVGDMFAGRGRIAFAYDGTGPRPSTSGDIALTGVRYRSFPLGDLAAQWATRNGVAQTHASLGGSNGALSVDGTIALGSGSARAIVQGATTDLHAKIAGLNVGTWLPLVGFSTPTVGGNLEIDAAVHGQALHPTADITADLSNGHVGRVPVDHASLQAHVTPTAVTLHDLAVEIPRATLSGEGEIGLSAGTPLSLTLHGHGDDVQTLAGYLMHLPFPVSGAVDADVQLTGTRAAPLIGGRFQLQNGAAAGLSIPRVAGNFSLHGRSLVLQDTQIDLAHGGLALSGSLPLTLAPFGVGPPTAPLSFNVDARSVDLADFNGLLPKGSIVGGVLSGSFGVTGTPADPQLVGGLSLVRGIVELGGETPLRDITGALGFAQQTVSLERLHAAAGNGTIDAAGRIVFPVAGRALDYTFDAEARRATIGLPGFFSGLFDGDVRLSRAQGRPLLSGGISVSNATIPFSALFAAGGNLGGKSLIPNDLGFDLALTAGQNVRVRSGALDIGGSGTVDLTGTLGTPRLGGRIEASPGGTLVYFNRVFRVIRGTVAFNPDEGLVPTMNALATVHVPNSDPDTSRNPSGYADITIEVTGSVDNLQIALSSNPEYPREQILGLLLGASALGAVNFGTTNTTGPATVGGNLSGAPQVAVGGLPPGLVSQQNGTLSVNQQAFGILNAQFTRALLSPIENTIGSALGLTTLDVTVDYGGAVGFAARKRIADNIYALYGQSVTFPLRQTFGIQAQPNQALSIQVTGFTQYGLTQFGTYPLVALSTNQQATLGQPQGGTSGFTFSVQKRYP